MKFDDILVEATREYFDHLTRGGHRIKPIEHAERQNYEGYVHASNLMDCAWKAAQEQLGTEDMAFPELHKLTNPSMQIRMIEGTTIAEIYQEAMVHWAQIHIKQTALYVYPEEFLIDQDLKLMGTTDLYCLGYDDHEQPVTTLVEFKHRAKNGYRSPEPRIGDVFQLLAYQEMVRRSNKNTMNFQAYLVIINTPSYSEFFDPTSHMQIWHLEQQPSGGYLLISNEGYLWNNPLNDSDFITQDGLFQEIERQHQYLAIAESSDQSGFVPPIALQADEAWQCRQISKKGGGQFRIMCPFWCHYPTKTRLQNYTEQDGKWMLHW